MEYKEEVKEVKSIFTLTDEENAFFVSSDDEAEKVERFTMGDVLEFQYNTAGKIICPAGNYTDISDFPSDCYFEDTQLFGDNVCFGKNCVFKPGSKFGASCTFARGCKFGPSSQFGECCEFGSWCEFGFDCTFARRCDFGRRGVFGHDCAFASGCTYGEDTTIIRGAFDELGMGADDAPILQCVVGKETLRAYRLRGDIMVIVPFFEGTLHEYGQQMGTIHGHPADVQKAFMGLIKAAWGVV